jgi:hypothetical protein
MSNFQRIGREDLFYLTPGKQETTPILGRQRDLAYNPQVKMTKSFVWHHELFPECKNHEKMWSYVYS